ncbi:hydroxyethylthiazole kinase, partial [Clostridium perfringens]|uniref:hydroxyethylthiazole kinase n=1 Tax=Clostridium perfringens TaxID=1502 RepID=UPI002ACE20D4
LIHCISNLVTARDLAQGILCYNGNPLISNSIEEAQDITSKCESLLINLEDLNSSKVDAIEKSLRVARRKRIPVVLDIMGLSFSFFRREVALRFISRYNINVVKGKLEDFNVLFHSNDKLKNKNFDDTKLMEDIEIRVELRSFSRRYNTIVVVQS